MSLDISGSWLKCVTPAFLLVVAERRATKTQVAHAGCSAHRWSFPRSGERPS